jgi:hypothetical protein
MKKHMCVWIYEAGLLNGELRGILLDSNIRECTFFTFFSHFTRILFAPTNELLYPMSVHA